MAIGANRRIIFIDGSILDYAINVRERRKSDRNEDYFEICYFRTQRGETTYKYLINDTVIFYRNCCGEIRVYSSMYQAGINLSTFKIKPHVEASFDIFKDTTRPTDDPIWMIQFLLDDHDISPVLKAYLERVFNAFISAIESEYYTNRIVRDYDPGFLYRCYKNNKNLTKNKPVDPTDFWPDILTDEGKAHYDKMYIMGGRGNGKTVYLQKQLYRMMMNSVYGKAMPEVEKFLNYIETGKENKMENMVNFRKSLEYLKRDKKNPNEFNIKFKDSGVIRKIEFQGATKKELYSDELIEAVLIIASRMMADYVAKVIFNLKNKMTIVFPWKYGLPEKTIVKANGADSFDILNGYTIATAKMMCSEDGYEWLNKLKKSGKVDV